MANGGLGCCSCLCACFIVIANIFAVLIGLVFLGIGIVIKWGLHWITSNAQLVNMMAQLQEALTKLNINIDIANLISNSILGSLGVAFIVTGVLVTAIAILGCCGACCKIKACLVIYAVVVGLVFVAQLVVVIIWYTDSNILKSGAKQAMESSVKAYRGYRNLNFESLLQDLMQITVGCCGANNGSDYITLNTQWDRKFNMSINGKNYFIDLTYPVTCCKFDLTKFQPINAECPRTNEDSNSHIGCYKRVFHYIDTYFLSYVFYSLIGSLAFQLLLVIGAIVIYCASERNRATKPTNRVV